MVSLKEEKNKKEKKKKIKKPKRTVTKSVEIQPKIDPLYKIMEESKDKPKEEIKVKELSDVDKPDKIKKEVEKPDEPVEEPDEPVEEPGDEPVEEPEEEPQFKKNTSS